MKKNVIVFIAVFLFSLFPIVTYAEVETDAGIYFSNRYTPTTSTEDTQLMPHEEPSKGIIEISSNATYPKTGSVENTPFVPFLGFFLLALWVGIMLNSRKKKKDE